MPDTPSASRMTWGLVGLATVVAAGVRLAGLGRHSLWLDELFTAHVVTLPGPAHIVDSLVLDVHPPGYYLAMWAWCVLAGSSEVALRLPSVLAGIACVPLLAALAGRLYGVRTAAAAAWLLALSPYAILMSQEARSNMLLATLATAASLALLRRHAVAYGLLCAALVWTHVFGLFVVLAHVLFALATGPRAWPRALVLAGLAGTCSLLPWASILAGQVSLLAENSWYALPPGDTLRWLVEGLSVHADGLVYLVVGGWLLALARRSDRDGPLLFAAFAVALVFVPLLISLAVTPILRVRSVLPLLPLLLAGAAAGLASLEPRPVRVGAVLLGVLVSLGVCTEAVFRAPPTEMWRDVAALVRAERTPGESIVANHPDLWGHYLGARPEQLAKTDDLPALQRSLWGIDGGWLLVGHAERPAVFAALPSIAEVTREETWTGIRWARFSSPEWTVPLVDFSVPSDRMKVDGALHFYWDSAATVTLPLLRVPRVCAVVLDADGDVAGGIAPILSVEVASGGHTESLEVPLSRGRSVYVVGPLPFSAEPELTLRFTNDGVDPDNATADRNAYVYGVRVRCT